MEWNGLEPGLEHGIWISSSNIGVEVQRFKLFFRLFGYFSGFSAIFPATCFLAMILMLLMVSETLELLNVSNNRSSYSLAIVHVKL